MTEEQQIRVKALELVHRAESDPEFAKKAKADPVGTLVAAGIPQHRAEAMIRPDIWCRDLTCWSSKCPQSCIVTVFEDLRG